MATEHMEAGAEHAEGHEGGHSPMEQFTIKPLIPIHVGKYDLSYTNSAMFMTFAVALTALLFGLSTKKRTLDRKSVV